MGNVYLTGVGSKFFVDNVKARLGSRAKGRDVIEGGNRHQLRERFARYKAVFEAEKTDMGLENTYFWNIKAQ